MKPQKTAWIFENGEPGGHACMPGGCLLYLNFRSSQLLSSVMIRSERAKRVSSAAERREHRDMERIGIIGAMEVEVETLKKDMRIERTLKKAGMEFCQGVLKGQEAVVVRSGIGKVNAAVCTQILVDDFQVKAVINTGIAGSLQAKIDIGDIVVSEDLVHHDMDVSALGYEPGQIPQMDVFAFQADQKLAQLATKVCREVNPDIGIFAGRVVSGDQFVGTSQAKERIVERFQGCCTEMEGAAIAQAAYLNQIPFVVLRAISDKADDSATMDYPTFERQAADHCVRLVEKMMEVLSRSEG